MNMNSEKNNVHNTNNETVNNAKIYVADDGTEFATLSEMIRYNCNYCQF